MVLPLFTVATVVTPAPSPRVTALAVTMPVGVIASVDMVTTFETGILDGSVIDDALALKVVGVPVISTVTVLFALVTVPTLNPGGSPVILLKCALLIAT